MSSRASPTSSAPTSARRRSGSPTGKAEIASYVKSLPARPAEGRRRGVARRSTSKFEQLETTSTPSRTPSSTRWRRKYVEARKGLDERIEALQAENKGLVDKAIGAIKAVINTIRELAAMLLNVLARVAGVVGDIIKDPIGFLGNLIAGVKGGILKFKDNILDHLQKGLMSWLFGALAEAGIELPDKFDLKGIIKLLAVDSFGLTWRNIEPDRQDRSARGDGRDREGRGDLPASISTAGVAGLWKMLLEKARRHQGDDPRRRSRTSSSPRSSPPASPG